MATPTKSEYTGDGSTQLFPIGFPYIEESDVVVSVDGTVQTIQTEYVFSNGQTIGFLVAPANGAKIVIQRVTSSDDLKATFFPGSAIRARDLNDNFTQNLYVTQESVITADDATQAAEDAARDAAIAVQAANDALNQSSQALAGVSVAQQAAVSAQNSATAAAADAAQAQADATQAAADAATAVSTANAAEAKADQALNSISAGPVQSVNGKSGVVSLGIGDLTDVDTSSAGHVPSDGQYLVWNAGMNHWMPATLVVPDSVPMGSWSGITEAT